MNHELDSYANRIFGGILGMSHVQCFLHRLKRSIQDPYVPIRQYRNPTSENFFFLRYSEAFGRMTNLENTAIPLSKSANV